MKNQYRLFRRNGTYYYEDATSGKQLSLRTKDETEASALLNAKNEAARQPALNRQIARTYLTAVDPDSAKRTWQTAMDAMINTKSGTTRDRCVTAYGGEPFGIIRNMPITETHSVHFLRVLESGAVSVNIYLRRLHNFALDMGWLSTPVLPKRQWPKVEYKDKRAITTEEHATLLKAEKNTEMKHFLEALWHLGGAQSDIAALCAEDIDWTTKTIAYARNKTGVLCRIGFGLQAAATFSNLPKVGPLFPSLARLHERSRAQYFKKRCCKVGIKGVTLHSYRYAWAERAMTCGLPERYAMICLGHTSKAIHRAYARRAVVAVPTLEEFETGSANSQSIQTTMRPVA